MVASRVGGKRPHAAKSPGATTTSWDLEKDDVQTDPTTLSGKAVTAGGDERRRRPAAVPGYLHRSALRVLSQRNRMICLVLSYIRKYSSESDWDSRYLL